MKSNKRSVSKTRENQGKNTPVINKSNLLHSKQLNKESQPILSKNALELIDKISDERFKNIKSNLEKETKKTGLKVVTTFSSNKKINNYSDNSPSKNMTSNNNHLKEKKNERFPSYSDIGISRSNKTEFKEMFVIRIQRWFRRILFKRKNDPQIEMKILLKKKKISILRNYNIKSKTDTTLESLGTISKSEKENQEIESLKDVSSSKDDNKNKKENHNNYNNIIPDNRKKPLNMNDDNTYLWKSNNPESLRMKSTKDEESNKNNIPVKKDNLSKISRNEAYDQRPKTSLKIEDLVENNNFGKIEEKKEDKGNISMIDEKRLINQRRNEKQFDFNNNSLTKDLSELNINNDIFTPNSNLNLNFNDNSKNIFSPLKNTSENNEDKHNLYNPLYTNNNLSINEEVKEIMKTTTMEKKDNSVISNENLKISQTNNQQYLNENVNKILTEPSIINPINYLKNNNEISSVSENKIILQETKNKNDTLNISNNSYLKPEEKILNTTNNKPNQFFDETKLNMISNTTNEKINQILSYLDETKKYSPKRNNSVNFIAPNVTSYNPPIRQTSAEILNMALELKEYKNTVATMKQVIEELKQVSKQKDEYYKDQYLSLQEKVKSDIAMIISNKDGIIDNLVAEKKAIVYELENVKEELSKQELSFNKKLTLLNDNFDAERKKDKDAWYVAEKARRKKWEETKLKEIKEMTIKGLEPEIERILQNHKQEMIKWEENQNEELRKQKERLNKEFEKRLIEQREKFQKEKEEALEHERNLFLQRARNQSERFEDEYSEERRRWNSNLTAEINKVEALREKDRKIHEDEIRLLEEKSRKMIEEKEEIHKQKVLDLEKRMNEKMILEVESVKFRLNKEKEAFTEEKQKEYESKYSSMKNEIMKDKEKQIELIIQKLGDETISERRKIQLECESRADERNKVLKLENEQMRNKIVELNDKLSGETKVRIMLDENLNILSKKVIDYEHENAKKDKKILDLTSSLNDYKDKYSNLGKEYSKEKMGIETDYQIKIDRHISDMKIMTEKIESMKNYYENKINEMKHFHESQINMLDSRVKKKIDSKEEVIKKLEEDLQYKNLTIQKYEEMLSRQRKELLMN